MAIGGVFSSIFNILQKVLKVLLSAGFFGAIVILTIIGVLISFVFLKMTPLVAFLSPLGMVQTKIAILSALALIIIPMIGLTMLTGRWFYPTKIKAPSYYLSITWIVSLGIFIFSAAEVGQYFSSFKTKSNLTNLSGLIKSKNLNMVFNDIEYTQERNGNINIGNIVIPNADKYISGSSFNNSLNEIVVKVLNRITVQKTEEKEMTILEQADNIHNEKITEGLLSVEDQQLVFNVARKIVKPEKYFGEHVSFKIFLPKGHTLNFDPKHLDLVELRDGVKAEESGGRIKVYIE